ncbi:MAG: hypothetical protein HY909_10420 [Deltaproteobacteria bacterium]|nr:hypothetical protein [Deltaproteobacteria bacterium]
MSDGYASAWALADMDRLAALLADGPDTLLGAFERCLRGAHALPEGCTWTHPCGAAVDRALLLSLEAALSYRSAMLKDHPEDLHPLLQELLGLAEGPSGPSLRALCAHWRERYTGGPWLRRVGPTAERPWCMHHYARSAPFALSPDCEALAVSEGTSASVLVTRTASVRFTTPGEPLALSWDGQRLAVALRDTVELWDVPSGERLAALPMRRRALKAAALDALGERLALLDDDGVVLYSASRGARRAAISPKLSLLSVQFTRDGGLLVAAHGGLYRLGADDGEEHCRWTLPEKGPIGYLGPPSLSRDHTRLAVGSSVGPAVVLLETQTLQELRRMRVGVDLDPEGVALSPEGDAVLAGAMGSARLRMLRASDGETITDLPVHGRFASFGPRLWEVFAGGALWCRFPARREVALLGRGGPPVRVWTSPDGEVCVGERRGVVSVWDARGWVRDRHLDPHPGISYVYLDAPSASVVAAGADTLSVWSAVDGRCRGRRSGRLYQDLGGGRYLVGSGGSMFPTLGVEVLQVGAEITSTLLQTGGAEGVTTLNTHRGQLLVSTGDGFLDAFTLEPLRRQFRVPGTGLTLHDGGRVLALEQGRETVFLDGDSGEELLRLPVAGSPRALSQDRALAVFVGGLRDVQVWHTSPPALRCRLALGDNTNTIHGVSLCVGDTQVETYTEEVLHISDGGPTSIYTRWSAESGARLGEADLAQAQPSRDPAEVASPALRLKTVWYSDGNRSHVLDASGAVVTRSPMELSRYAELAGRHVVVGIVAGGIALYELVGLPTPKDPAAP